MKLHFPEDPEEVHTIVCDEREFVFDDPLGQRPVRLAAQAEVIDVGCLETGGMGQPDQRLMQALVDQEPRTLPRRALSRKDFVPRAFFPRQGRRLGRPRLGNARMYSGAMPIFSLFSVE